MAQEENKDKHKENIYNRVKHWILNKNKNEKENEKEKIGNSGERKSRKYEKDYKKNRRREIQQGCKKEKKVLDKTKKQKNIKGEFRVRFEYVKQN